MIYLKEANVKDAEKEYQFLKDTPVDENGFENKYYDFSYEVFAEKALPEIIKFSKGIDLPQGYVPQTLYFLWDDNNIVGLFKIRHHLTDSLKNGAGHIGYGIHKNYRGKGYASKGLALAIEKANDIIRENEIYLSVHIDNPASLKVQLNNGAYIHHSDKKEHYTRIKI
ncbi:MULTISPECIES: GNAT family N-acetyltransferase [Clostridium]|uniref:GNAT family N-acetyltransferase n=1 Tax=Clostridium TaxID=1485 RepID=UPI000825D399|nr:MULTISPECIES: GNAT family N-acetyltransferase [Clostridium]PJI09529.1 GNAT family N-acetyltransferase [Clostridium sp. CT7]